MFLFSRVRLPFNDWLFRAEVEILALNRGDLEFLGQLKSRLVHHAVRKLWNYGPLGSLDYRITLLIGVLKVKGNWIISIVFSAKLYRSVPI